MEYDLWRPVDRHIYRRRNQPAGLAASMSVFLNCEENAERLIRDAHTLLAELLADERDP